MINQNYDFARAKDFFSDYVTYNISPYELADMIDNSDTKDIQIVDLRTLADYQIAHIAGAIHIPEEHLLDNLDRLDKNKTIVLYCYNQFCQLSAKCTLKLLEKGYRTIDLLGGFKTWKKYRFAIES